VTTSTRTQRPKARTGRVSRASAAGPARRSTWRAGPAARGPQPRRVGLAGGWLQRRQPEKSGVRTVISRVSGTLPGLGKASSKKGGSPTSAKRGSRVGGLALLTAAAGLAFKNRDKIASKLSRDQSGGDQTHAASSTTERSGTRVGTTDISGQPSAAPSTGDPAPSHAADGPRDWRDDAGRQP